MPELWKRLAIFKKNEAVTEDELRQANVPVPTGAENLRIVSVKLIPFILKQPGLCWDAECDPGAKSKPAQTVNAW